MSYIKEKGSFTGADGTTQIKTFLYLPESEPRGILQFSHGMCEYIERYEKNDGIRRLTEAGWIFAGHDHAGHGTSAASPEDLGYFGDKDGWRCLVEDIHTLTGMLKDRFPGLPVVLCGHSMGSFIAREVLRFYGSDYAAAVICGTAGPNPAAGAGILMANLIGKLKGSRYRSPFLQNLAFGSYNKRFEGRTPYDWLTRDTAVVDAYAVDPFCTYLFTAAGFKDLFTLVKRVGSSDWAPSLPKDVPLWLIAGQEDPVGDYGKGVTTVYERLKAAGCNAEMKLYPGMRHEIHNEQGSSEVFDDLLTFIGKIR